MKTLPFSSHRVMTLALTNSGSPQYQKNLMWFPFHWNPFTFWCRSRTLSKANYVEPFVTTYCRGPFGGTALPRAMSELQETPRNLVSAAAKTTQQWKPTAARHSLDMLRSPWLWWKQQVYGEIASQVLMGMSRSWVLTRLFYKVQGWFGIRTHLLGTAPLILVTMFFLWWVIWH